MTKYKVSKAAMDELNGLKELEYQSIWDLLGGLGLGSDLFTWIYCANSDVEHEQAVIDYAIHHKDNFEDKKPTWVIVSKKADTDGDWWAFIIEAALGFENWESRFPGRREYAIKKATRITDPKLKDALLYANKDFEAIEVE